MSARTCLGATAEPWWELGSLVAGPGVDDRATRGDARGAGGADSVCVGIASCCRGPIMFRGVVVVRLTRPPGREGRVPDACALLSRTEHVPQGVSLLFGSPQQQASLATTPHKSCNGAAASCPPLPRAASLLPSSGRFARTNWHVALLVAENPFVLTASVPAGPNTAP